MILMHVFWFYCFFKNEQATSSPKNGYLHSVLKGNLPMSAQLPNLAPAIPVQQLSECAGTTSCTLAPHCSRSASRGQTVLLCLFALRAVQRVVCVRALQYISRGQRTQCVLPPANRATVDSEGRENAAPLSASACRSLGRLVGNVLGVGHIAVLGPWARCQVDAVAARRILHSEPSVRGQ